MSGAGYKGMKSQIKRFRELNPWTTAKKHPIPEDLVLEENEIKEANLDPDIQSVLLNKIWENNPFSQLMTGEIEGGQSVESCEFDLNDALDGTYTLDSLRPLPF